MGYDLLIVCLLSVILELIIMKKKYVLFSPYFIFHISILYIYIIPLLIYGMSDTLNYLNRLDFDVVLNLCNKIRMFYYLFAAISVFLICKLSKKERVTGIRVPFLSKRFVLISILLLTIVSIFTDLMKVNFSLSTFIDMQLNPRNYTYLREGLGPLTYIVNFSKMFLLFVCVIYFLQRKNLASFCLFCYGALFNLSGGSKTSLFVVMIFVIIFVQKIRKIKINFRIIISTIFSFLVIAIISFSIMSGSRNISSFKEAIIFIIDYAQEAYFSARVLKDFTWTFNNIIIEIRSLLLTPIPRALFENKSLYGFYQECWRGLYQQGSVIYQSSTYGFVSEAHMLFGKIAPFISAIGINIFLYSISNLYNRSNTITSLFISGYLFTRVYFFTRSGYLEATSVWALILFILFTRVFILALNVREKGRYYVEINCTST